MSEAHSPGPDRARALHDAWQGRPVAVIGDVMLDRYLWGRVSRISPEAPVPVVEVERESFRLGGAANVAHNVAALGASPRLLGVVGEDAGAERFRTRLDELGIDGAHLRVDPARPTSQKTRIVAQSQHLVRVDEESRDELAGTVETAVRDAALALLDEAAAVILSDYGKGVITRGVLDPLLAEANRRGVPVCVDPKDLHFFAYRGVAVVTPNQHEAAEVLGYKLRDDAAVDRAGAEILERLGSDAVLVTRGEHGMSLFTRDGARRDFAATARDVYDVTGAGDTVTSTYAVVLAGGGEAAEAAWMANRAAGQVVQEVGTAVPDPARLLAEAGQ